MDFIEALWAVVAFLVGQVILKGIVAHAIAKWLVKRFKQYTKKTDRTEAIRLHYLLRANGGGHKADNVLDCREQNCLVFQPVI